jgi:purine-nucleoside phosphorylase
MQEAIKTLRVKIEQSLEAIKRCTDLKPEVGIILGTGLGRIASEIGIKYVMNYEEIPNFPLSTVESHSGKLIFGLLGNKNIVAMQGRFHYYEGYSMHQITFPVRVIKALGAKTLFISNACGTVNPYFRKGHIMLIADHINLLGDNPLRGPNDEQLGVRFPDMSEPYSQRLIDIVEKIALEKQISIYKGVYAAMSGPTLETRAEYRFLRTIGADVVGMSTVPECIVACHAGMEVLGMSLITDECYPESLKKTTLEEIIAVANQAEPHLTTLLREAISRI